jgi:hypothetical protein
MAVTTDFSNWDFLNYRVQSELKGGQFVSAESTLVAAGPPTLPSGNTGAENGIAYPIGLLESVGLQQSRQLQRIFEIGSTRSYFVPGRTVGSLSLGRTFYYGPSLLRVLYAYYSSAASASGPAIGTGATQSTKTLLGANTAIDGLHQIRRTPGYGFMFIDLASDLFAQPTGIAIYFKDANYETLGGFYLEETYIQGHQMNISSGSVLIMEGASAQYDRIVPLNVESASAPA